MTSVGARRELVEAEPLVVGLEGDLCEGDILATRDSRLFDHIEIVREALTAPLRHIAINAGLEGAIVVDRVLNGEGSFGFNARSGEWGDLVAEGVIDPTKVVRSALQNAASIAGLMLTTEAMIADMPKDEGAAPAMPDMGGMM